MKNIAKPPKLLDKIRLKLREYKYRPSTEKLYIYWIRRFILFHNKKHPATMGEKEVSKFLNHLTLKNGVSYSTQRQALSAILFLYRAVLITTYFPYDFADNIILINRPTNKNAHPKSNIGKKSNGHKLKVFLCHAQEDKPIIRRLYSRLIKDGVQPWFDVEDIIAGQDWEYEIEKAVRNSDIVVACLSNKSVTKSGYVQKEIKYALDIADRQPEGAIFIIPLKLEDCPLLQRLSKWQALELFKKNGYKNLKKSLNKRVSVL